MVYVGGLGRTIGQRRRSGGESEVAGGRHPGEHRVPLEEKPLRVRCWTGAVGFLGLDGVRLKVDPVLGEELQARKKTLQAMWSNPILKPVKKLQGAVHKITPTKIKNAKANAIVAMKGDESRQR